MLSPFFFVLIGKKKKMLKIIKLWKGYTSMYMDFSVQWSYKVEGISINSKKKQSISFDILVLITHKRGPFSVICYSGCIVSRWQKIDRMQPE